MKKVIKWDKPEFRFSAPDHRSYVEDIWKVISGISNIRPKFLQYAIEVSNRKPIEENGLYIGCNVRNIPDFTSGFSKKLNSEWKDISSFGYNSVYIHPGTFSLYLQNNDNHSEIIFSYYKDQNAIAMTDFFSTFYETKEHKDPSNKKLLALLKIILKNPEKSFKNYDSMITTFEEIQKELEKIFIGSDPEFSIVLKEDTNNLVNASAICKTTQDFLIGTDGHPTILELRPTASNNLDQFLKNIDESIYELSEMVDPQKYSILTGGGKFAREPLGGHIHFSNMQPAQEFLEMLDTYIGIPLQSCANGKRSEGGGNYGKLSDWRNNDYNGFEYRTPPSFFSNEKLTKSVYIIAYLLSRTYINSQKSKKIIEYDSNPCLKNYKLLIDYEKYKDYIDYFWNFTKNKEPLMCCVYEKWNILKKKDIFCVNVPILKTDDTHLSELLPEIIKIYKPPFRAIKFYGISEKTTDLRGFCIDSVWISGNVNLGWLHKWISDYVRNSSIIDSPLISEERLKSFVNDGILSIGLTLPFRNELMNLTKEIRETFFKEFLKRLALFVRVGTKDLSTYDQENEQEVAEFKRIMNLLS